MPSEPARLQLLCELKQGLQDVAALIGATGFSQSHISRKLASSSGWAGVRAIWRADDDLVEDLSNLLLQPLLAVA